MSFRKFDENDIFTNTMRAAPSINFYVFNAKVYYNNIPDQSGHRNVVGNVRIPEFTTLIPNLNSARLTTVRDVQSGHISLYEYNIDRPVLNTDRIVGATQLSFGKFSELKSARDGAGEPIDFVQDRSIIYPYISKDGTRAAWKTVSKTGLGTAFKYGDILTSSYPQSASVSRQYISTPFASTSNYNKSYVALRNRLDFYSTRSPFYKVNSLAGNKDNITLNLISVPSIFYGTKIKPGTISLKFYITGSLVGELQDIRENGELVQVGPVGSTGSGSVAGVALYDEGFMLLSGAWNLTSETFGFIGDSATKDEPKWVYFGAGMHDSTSSANTADGFTSASYEMDFKGHTETQVLTMFAHANRGQANYSNNPTFIERNQSREEITSSHIYQQKDDVTIKNIVSSSYNDYAAPFKRQLYISRIGIYDDYKNLIGLATLSNPILKKEEDNISFKLKLDI